MNYGDHICDHHLKSNPQSIEVISRRNEVSKTFDNLDGTFTWIGKIGAIHYKENYRDLNEQWKEIDTTPVDKGDYFLVDKAPIIVKIFKDRVGYEITSRRSGHKFTVELEGKRPKGEDVEFRFDVQASRVRLWKTIKTDKVNSLKWKVTEENRQTGRYSLKFREIPEAFDDNQNEAEVTTRKTVIDGRSFYWEEKLGKVYERQTIPEILSHKPKKEIVAKYPIRVDTDVDEDVGASADDAWDPNDNAWDPGYTATTVWVGAYYGNYDGISGSFRFQTVNIPQGSTITVATMNLVVVSTNTGIVPIDIYCEDVDDAPNFDGGTYINGRTKTSAHTVWNPDNTGWSAGQVKTTPDFAGAVEEVIGRAGWVANNDLVVMLIGASAEGNYDVNWASWDHATYDSAHLDITYSEGGPTPKNVSDSASGNDSLSVGKKVSLQDSNLANVTTF